MNRILDIHPALGFETIDRWKVAVHQRDEQIRLGGGDPQVNTHRLWGEQRMGINNLSKFVAYIPGLNVIVGIARIILLSKDKTSNPQKKEIVTRHIYRGFAEIFLGPLLLIPDVVQTFLDRGVVQDYVIRHPGVI